jgi:hypothetical protein
MGSAWAEKVEWTPRSTSSAGKKRILTLTVPLDDRAQAVVGQLDHLAEQALLKSERYVAPRLSEELDRNNTEVRQVRARAGEANWSLGMRAYEELDTKKAEEHLGEAVKAFKQADLTRNFPSLIKAWVMRVAALLANGHTRAANLEIDKVLAVDPRAVFSPDYFPPDTLKLVEDARQNTRNQMGAFIEVKTSPPGAQVYVNGQFRGVSPMRIDRLPQGEHFLNVSLAGYSMVQQLAVPGLNELTLLPAESQGRWKSAVENIRREAGGAGRDEAAVLFGKWLNVDQVLLTLVRSEPSNTRAELSVFRLDCSDGHNWAYQRASVSLGEGLVPEADLVFHEAAGTDTPRRDGAPVTHFHEGRSSAPSGAPFSFSATTLTWSLLGTAAALLVGGVVTASLAGGQNAQFRETAHSEPEAVRLKSSGQSLALTADLLFLGSLLAGAPGGYLLFQELEKPPENGPILSRNDRAARTP